MRQHIAYHYPYPKSLDFEAMNRAGDLLKQYKEFRPFCKTGSDTPHYLCDMTEASWTHTETDAVFDISANRFLRGMVRLIVGMMIDIGRGNMTLDDLRMIMEQQRPLDKPESAPGHGLSLVDVQYPQ